MQNLNKTDTRDISSIQPYEALEIGFANRFKLSKLGASQLLQLLYAFASEDPNDEDIQEKLQKTEVYFKNRFGQNWVEEFDPAA
jgi:hypothetical protein